ncbi:MAG TPA: glycosyltransferase family 4 protein [Lacipirellulaceae bacterium]|nr:glycosyltransferase family 4 protein [Lacipirellulaceae bacterium]
MAAAFSSRRRREAVIIGTDPVFAVLAAAPWRLFHPRAQVIHWCFDVYPDAIVAEGAASPDSLLVRMLQRLVAAAYRRCDAIAGLGPCMARRLAASAPEVPSLTITPWALIEPDVPPSPDVETRKALFGDAALGLLYSGSFGRAHSHPEFMDLARRLRHDDIAFCFAGRGHRMDELRAAVEPADTNILFAGFAPEEELERRLAACDLHLVSLRQEWTGTVVPSKFFGALAAGRGVIFAGSAESSIAHWIREFQVGWVLLPETGEEVASELRELVRRPERIRALRAHCHAVYQERFSRERMLEKWEALLRPLGGRGPRVTETHELSEVGGGHSRAN